MKRKGWFIPILVSLLCMGFLFIYQKSQISTSLANPSSIPPVLWSFKTEAVTSIKVEAKGKKIEANKEANSWVLKNDAYGKANTSYIHSLLSMYKEPRLLTIVSTDTTQLANYGIDATSKKISIVTETDNGYELVFGSQTIEGDYYVYAPFTKTVYTIGKDSFTLASTNLVDWREPNYLRFNKATISKITLAYEGVEHTLTPVLTDSGTTFTSPSLSQDTIDKIILFLESTRIEAFITDEASPQVLSTYGFTNPLLKISLYPLEGQPLTIHIGSMSEDTNLGYVTLNDSKLLFAIPYFEFISLQEVLSAEVEGNETKTDGIKE